jgi:hypothetical protein
MTRGDAVERERVWRAGPAYADSRASGLIRLLHAHAGDEASVMAWPGGRRNWLIKMLVLVLTYEVSPFCPRSVAELMCARTKFKI